MIHYLKMGSEDFQAVLDGRRPYDLRTEDGQRFAKGDTLVFQEFIPYPPPTRGGRYTGRTCAVLVLDEPLRDMRWLQPGVAALAIQPMRDGGDSGPSGGWRG